MRLSASGFLTKMLQALLVVPVFAAVYLIVAPNRLRTRILQLLASCAALIVSAGWWIAVVELMPESMRPYIEGHRTNSIMELVLGYNGLGRPTGNEVGSVVPGAALVGWVDRAVQAAVCGARPALAACSR